MTVVQVRTYVVLSMHTKSSQDTITAEWEKYSQTSFEQGWHRPFE